MGQLFSSDGTFVFKLRDKCPMPREMRFTLLRTDKTNVVHLTTKTAEAFIERIKTDTKGEDIGRLRDYIASFGDNGAYENHKPVATVLPQVELKKEPNGCLTTVAFNGIAWLHAANLLRKDDILAVKNASKVMPMTMAAFVGADGCSVELLVKVCKEDGDLPQNDQDIDDFCRAAYDVAFNAYQAILPKPLERHAVSARSSFRMTLDAEPYFNPKATPMMISMMQKSEMHVQNENTIQEQDRIDMNLYADYEQIYKRAVVEAKEVTKNVAGNQHFEAYLTVLAHRLCEAGLPEEEALLHIRNHHIYKQQFDEDTLRAIVSSAYAETGQKKSVKGGESLRQDTRELITYLTTHYVFRYNTVMGYTEYRPNNTWIYEWQNCDDRAINGLTIEARLAGLQVKDHDVRRYVRSNLIRKFDPIESYLWELNGKWDGKDHIRRLARTVPCDLKQWEDWFYKWFLYMVAQWLGRTRRYGNSVVPLLISRQGNNKSTFCRSLLPEELQWGYSDNLMIDDKKQTLQAMHNFLLINLDEFNQISPRVQEGFLKNVVQLARVKVKRPYGKHVEDFPRLASFIATTNETNVLADPTGSRRFIAVLLTGPIDVEYRPNYQQLYAQAVTAVLNGEQYWFADEEVREVMAHNRQFQMEMPAEQFFREYFDIVESEAEGGTWMTVTAIFQRLRKLAGSSLKVNGVTRLGRILFNIEGIQRRKTHDGIKYLVREKV